jgi:hypothetical protein
MAGETMTPNERLWAAIRLEKPDRVPVIPTLLPEPAAGLAGILQASIAADNRVAVDAVFHVFDEYGGWENPYPACYRPVQLQAWGYHPMRMRIPGVNLPDDVPFQLEEAPVLEPSDYDRIAEMGFTAFYEEDFFWRITDLRPEEVPSVREALLVGGACFLAKCADRGILPFCLGSGLHPFFTLSLMRSMVAFTQDLHYDPKPLERALRRMTDDLIERQTKEVPPTGIPIWLCSEERASGFFFRPQVFERFWWPYTREIVDAMWSQGIVTVFHLDTPWDRNIRYFKDLPRGSAVLEFDSTTDIFAAKEILRGHLCLKGDVPAALLSLGEPRQVEDYCKERIDRVGGDGGFILGTGCSVPPNARPENFRALLETGKHYELSR